MQNPSLESPKDESKETALEELRAHLRELPPGRVWNSQEVESLLAASWDELKGGDQGGLTAGKLFGRTEDMEWCPPSLRFRIERHGGTVLGSVYAEMQHWTVNVEHGYSELVSSNDRRLMGRKNPPLKVGPIVQELVELILARKPDVRLSWMEDYKVRVLIGETLREGSAPKETLTARRKRLRLAMREALTARGWRETARHTYVKGPSAS